MHRTPDENAIDSAIAETGLPRRTLDPADADRLRRAVVERYAGRDFYPLWDEFTDAVSRRRADGWSKATEFVGEGDVILFLDKSDGATMWQFSSGEELRVVLENAPFHDFYLTDPDISYVLCHNHHDYLIGIGACESWLSALDDDK